MGRAAPGDVIGTTLAIPIIVSKKVIRVLEDGRFSGWSTYPVALKGRDGKPLSGFYGLAVKGRCGPIDNSKSRTVKERGRGGEFMTWRGLYFSPDSWDGADVFISTDNVGWIFVVEGVKAALERSGVKTLSFTPLDQVERMPT